MHDGRLRILSFVVLASVSPVFCQADDLQFENQLPDVLNDRVDARISALEEQIEWLKQNQTPQRQQAQCSDALGTVERQLACRESCSGGLLLGVETSFLRPYISGARSSANGSGGKWIEPSYGTATRLMLGYKNNSGLGVRARYFSMNHGINLASSFGGGKLGLDLEVIDAEVTFDSRLRSWDIGVSAGVRYGDLAYTGDGVVIFPGQFAFEGVGVTTSIDGRRELGDSGLTLFGNLRGSFLMGEIHNNNPVRGVALGELEDEIMQVLEHQMGIAWTAYSKGRTRLEIKAAWETQFWLNDTIADDEYGIGSNLALSGPSVAIELKY